MSLSDRTGPEVASIGWLRNPFGLEPWAESAILDRGIVPTDLLSTRRRRLVDTSITGRYQDFKEVVDLYWNVIASLESSFFAFDVGSYIQFVQPYLDLFPQDDTLGVKRVTKSHYKHHHIFIPMEYFGVSVFSIKRYGSMTLLGQYKQWFEELVEFATLLAENPDLHLHYSE